MLETLRSTKTSLRRSTVPLLARNKVLMKELKQSKEKMKSLQNEDLQHRLQKQDIQSAQLLLISEYVTAAECTAHRNRRCTYDWLLLCLLHICTSSTWSFLRNDEILPLPSITTMRKYIRMRGLPCGLDKLFLTVLVTKTATKSPLEQREMLLLDEVQSMQELAVHSKSKMNSGLVDYAHDD
ncbi:hypothetical protein HPB48_019782 [Haemaphysalis longicornis]|uniref:Uncharacterized protein n=1 Tax=Haemaphysalis longicornis TaxID=44386 RepID=A0A9J6GB61_HAELO|nr:hypothetical protein HPB48_019782 [Haemaphysalis longicornis]